MSMKQWATDYTPEKHETIKSQDVIVQREKIEITIDKDGNEVKKRTLEPVNLSKQLRETVLTLKANTINEKIKELRLKEI